MLNLHSPRVFHSLMVRSREAETICRLSAENETLGESVRFDRHAKFLG